MGNKREKIHAVIDNLRRLFQTINDYSKSAGKIMGLTGPQLWAIKLLANDAPLRVSDLARRMFHHPATAVGILNRLETRGLVTRIRSKEDRRVVDVELTPLGKEVVANAPEVAQVMLVKGLGALSDEELSSVTKGIEMVARIVGADRVYGRL